MYLSAVENTILPSPPLSLSLSLKVSGDMLFSHNFDVGQVLDFFKLRVSFFLESLTDGSVCVVCCRKEILLYTMSWGRERTSGREGSWR